MKGLKKLAKAEIISGKAKKAHAEVRPGLNRYLVISADDFLRVAANKPTKEAYLGCLDKGLARVAQLATSPQDRKDVAEYYQELMEIVGLESSDGRRAAFVAALNAPR